MTRQEATTEMYGLTPDQQWCDNSKLMRKMIYGFIQHGYHPAFEKLDRENLYQRLFPKTYNLDGKNYDPTLLGVSLFETMFATEPDVSDVTQDIAYDTWNTIDRELHSFDWRTYFLDGTCAEMINRSHYNDSVDMSETLFTMPAFTVSLPKGIDITDSKDNDPVIAIAVCRSFTICHTNYSKEFRSVSELDLQRWGIRKEDLNNLNKLVTKDGEGSWKQIRDSWTGFFQQKGRFPDGVELAPVLNIGGITKSGENMPIRFPLLDISAKDCLDFLYSHELERMDGSHPLNARKNFQGNQAEESLREARQLTEFTLKLLLFMAAKPQEVETNSRLLKPARVRRGKLMNDNKWSPCYIGRKYGAEMKSKGYGERGKIRAHWRQGHFRGVWAGKGRSKHLIKWIDPCYVNDPDKG